jgi:hypothetical protein
MTHEDGSNLSWAAVVRASILLCCTPGQSSRKTRAIACKVVQIVGWRTNSCKWRRESPSIPIDVQGVFRSSTWAPTVLATSNWLYSCLPSAPTLCSRMAQKGVRKSSNGLPHRSPIPEFLFSHRRERARIPRQAGGASDLTTADYLGLSGRAGLLVFAAGTTETVRSGFSLTSSLERPRTAN